MHRRISQSEVERIKECFNCCRPYEYSKSYSGEGHERSHSQFSNYGSQYAQSCNDGMTQSQCQPLRTSMQYNSEAQTSLRYL